jgi:hypothetical protein
MNYENTVGFDVLTAAITKREMDEWTSVLVGSPVGQNETALISHGLLVCSVVVCPTGEPMGTEVHCSIETPKFWLARLLRMPLLSRWYLAWHVRH